MTTQEKDRIQSAIDHIKTAADVDEWAMELAVEALQKQIPKKPIPDGYKDKCPVCGLIVKFGEYYCKGCGQKLRWDE